MEFAQFHVVVVLVLLCSWHRIGALRFVIPYHRYHQSLKSSSYSARTVNTACAALRNSHTTSYNELRVAVLGGGAFSLALSKVLSYKDIKVNLLVRNDTIAHTINEKRFHPRYLSSSIIPMNLWATTDPVAALTGVDYVVHAIPMQQSRGFLENMKHLIPPDIPVLSVTKGVEMDTFCLMNEVLNQTLGKSRPTAYLSGPSFAQEIMDGKATAVVIASTDSSLAAELSEMLSNDVFRCHVSRDVKVL